MVAGLVRLLKIKVCRVSVLSHNTNKHKHVYPRDSDIPEVLGVFVKLFPRARGEIRCGISSLHVIRRLDNKSISYQYPCLWKHHEDGRCTQPVSHTVCVVETL